jgi:hypothetical protein
MLGGVLECIRHIDFGLAIGGNHMDPKGGVAGREIRVGESAGEIGELEIGVIDFHFSAAKISGEQKIRSVVRDHSQSFVHGTGSAHGIIYGKDYGRASIPAGDRSVLRVKDK